jgi:uncharacterized membrane-anchored protein
MSDSAPASLNPAAVVSKVPAITLGFWAIKILATTLGETAGDSVSMSFADSIGMTHDWGYVIGTLVFLPLLLVLAATQIMARRFAPWLYWGTILASTMAGTTMADYATRSLGIGYPGGSLLLFALVLACLLAWRLATGHIAADAISTRRDEGFYWLTITFSQTLGTALGDWVADLPGIGYLGGALIFGTALLLTWAIYRWTGLSRVLLFWAAFILTRPLGATVGDFLDKPYASGGLDFSRPLASLVLIVTIALLIWRLPQRAGNHPA